MSGLTGIAPLTGLSSLLNAAGQPDAGSAARAAPPAPVTDAGRVPAAATPRPVAEAASPERPPVTRNGSRTDRERPENAAAARQRDGDLAAARARVTDTLARLRLDVVAENGDQSASSGTRRRQFVEGLDAIRKPEPRDITPELVAEARVAEVPVGAASVVGARVGETRVGGAPQPNPKAPLVDDGIPVPVEALPAPSEPEEAPFGQNDDLPKPVEIEVGDFPAESAEAAFGQDDDLPGPVEPLVAETEA